MDIHLNERNNPINNNFISPYCNTPKAKTIFNLSNIIYDQNFVSLIRFHLI